MSTLEFFTQISSSFDYLDIIIPPTPTEYVHEVLNGNTVPRELDWSTHYNLPETSSLPSEQRSEPIVYTGIANPQEAPPSSLS